MHQTIPVRFVFLSFLFSAGVLSGFLLYSQESGGDLKAHFPKEISRPFKTKIRGETTDIGFAERMVLVEWMKFDQNQVTSVCRATEIIRNDNKIFLKNPVLYDYEAETKMVTRTSGNFGEAVLKDDETRDLDTIKVWGDATVFRYKTSGEGIVRDENVR